MFNWPNFNFSQNAPPANGAALAGPRYYRLTQDKRGHPKLVSDEDEELFARHYPIGNAVPMKPPGATADEVIESVRAYCAAMQLAFPGETAVATALSEMVEAKLVWREND